MTGTRTTTRRTTTVDPRLALRARELLGRAEAMAAHADDSPEPTEQLRALYLAALRAAGAALVVGEKSTARPRRGPVSAWARLPRALPELTTWATYFAGLSRLRADIELGVVRDVDPRSVQATRTRLADFLEDVRAQVVAFEHGTRVTAGHRSATLTELSAG
ncbi:MAG: SAV_6107 family HEPN domain-containing protein [Corynebacteriales bacterium]|uniref:SAV_6107 family HEPN domain-containing protein n=1 Tax=Williamsia herbipolensis TaxID=1603258 RepID=A0AAU4K4P4_9NOCA|nr:SAV_6107 family HEPN domain-containing protein [Williamsia herbipolensis]MCX6470663.1 SAV_6107 family HEPN domain-containing protein [Mycobacteriales bacterium]